VSFTEQYERKHAAHKRRLSELSSAAFSRGLPDGVELKLVAPRGRFTISGPLEITSHDAAYFERFLKGVRMSKSWWRSKSLWFNILGFAASASSIPLTSSPKVAGGIAVASSLANIGLRLITSQPIAGTAAAAAAPLPLTLPK
jgi:hypothetical protein